MIPLLLAAHLYLSTRYVDAQIPALQGWVWSEPRIIKEPPLVKAGVPGQMPTSLREQVGGN